MFSQPSMGIDHNKTWRLPLGLRSTMCFTMWGQHSRGSPSGYGEVMVLYLHFHWDTFVMFSGAVPALRFLSGYISPYGSRSRGPWSFICAKAVRVMLANPRESFFRVRERFVLSAKVSRKLDIMNHYHCIHYSMLRATNSCRPGSCRRMVPHHR